MYAGLRFTAKTTNPQRVAEVFTHIMTSHYQAIAKQEVNGNEALSVTASAFHGNLASCYEISLMIGLDDNALNIAAWGDAREVNSDELLAALSPLSHCLDITTVQGECYEHEADASDDDEPDVFALNLPQAWFGVH